ncbi:MAG: ABC transporter substrate-binding protein [Thermocrispum sp.]
MNTRTLSLRRALAALSAATLVLAGCADRAPEPAAPVSGGFPVTVTPPGGEPLTLERKPEKIVSLSPSATEALYAVGAGEQVVAVDDQSNYPKDVPRTKLSGLTPSPEQIADYEPDLVVVSSDVDKLSAALAEIDVPTLVLPDATTLTDAYAQFELVGEVTGHPDGGKDVATRVKSEIAKIVRDTPKPAQPLSYYHELDQTLYTATSATFVGEVYGLFGLRNIADGDDPKANGGYPQLSAEKVIDANPDLIFLADAKCCGQTYDTVRKRPGWDTLTAVKQQHVFPLDDDIASRWSPRIVDLVRDVADAVEAAG